MAVNESPQKKMVDRYRPGSSKPERRAIGC